MANDDKTEATGDTFIHTKTIRNTHRHTQTCKHRYEKIQIKQIQYKQLDVILYSQLIKFTKLIQR